MNDLRFVGRIRLAQVHPCQCTVTEVSRSSEAADQTKAVGFGVSAVPRPSDGALIVGAIDEGWVDGGEMRELPGFGPPDSRAEPSFPLGRGSSPSQ